jgi:hypothetical protein
MALSTTQSIWRSGGGDTTRTAYCGSGLMAAQFYIADASPATAGTNIKVSSDAGAPNLILPAGAVVTSVSITAETGSGTFDIGATGYTSGTADNNAIASGVTVAVGTTNVGAVVTGAPLAEMSYVTVTDNTTASGTVTGFITYFVTDPLVGQQNV